VLIFELKISNAKMPNAKKNPNYRHETAARRPVMFVFFGIGVSLASGTLEFGIFPR
jgi:hypothetical protein